MTAQEAVNEIVKYISSWGGVYSKWYIGIATDPEDRLTNGHRVEKAGHWIYCPCDSSSNARAAERHLIDKLGTQGGQGGGDDSTKSVYAYKITPYTVESA